MIKVDKLICSCVNSEAIEKPKYFTQFNVYRTLELYYKEIKNSNIEEAIATLEVNSAKIVNTIEGTSVEGQNLTGKKLIIIGMVNTKTIIRYPSYDKKLCVLERKLAFSTFIIIPNTICNNQPINLRYMIEDVTTTIIGNKLFISVTLLIEYVDEYIT